MNKYRSILIFVISLLVACNTIYDDVATGGSLENSSKSVAIAINQNQTTKTAINADDMSTVEWIESDCIYLWAQASGASDYVIDGVEFKYKFYNSTYADAAFTAEVNSQTEDQYSYFGVYPKPESVNGSEVSYSLPATQSGVYDGELDIMSANPILAGALQSEPLDDVALNFTHLTHAVRINIPEGRNLLGKGVKSLKITFPDNVTGDFVFDAAVADAECVLSGNESSVVTLDFEQEIDEGDYAWLFIAPTTLVGELSFIAYDSDGYSSNSISVDIDKTMEAGKITPITLTVPTSNRQKTTLSFSIIENNLGEDIESVTLTAPSGALFTNGLSSETVTCSAEGEFSVDYYADAYGDIFKTGSISLAFESESAIVDGGELSLFDIVDDEINSLTCSVPYLYATGFSEITEDGSTETSTTTIDGLSGWVAGNRSAWWAGKCVAVRSYSNFGGPYDSRINSATLDAFGLKSDAKVTLKVLFDSDWNKNKSSSMSLSVGRSTSTSAGGTISGGESVSLSSLSSSINQSSEFTSREVTITECESTHRIVWESDGTNGTIFNYDYVYIDNVYIQIIK